MNKIVGIIVVAVFAVACADVDDIAPVEATATLNGQTACMLDFLNTPRTDIAALDEAAHIDTRAARALITHRDGPDGIFGTADDNPFDSWGEAASINWVGEATIAKLESYSQGWCLSRPGHTIAGTFHGVSFTHKQAQLVVKLTNTLPEPALRHLLDFNEEAAQNILDRRPFVFLYDIAHTQGVQAIEIEMLRSASEL